MKNKIILFATTVCMNFIGICQESSDPLISQFSTNNIEFSKANLNDFKIESNDKKPITKDTILLKKLQVIEDMIKKLELSLKDSLKNTLKNLPSMVNQEHINEVTRLTQERDALIQSKISLETEKNKIIAEHYLAESKVNTDKAALQNKISSLEAENRKIESENMSILSKKTSEWEVYTTSYIKNEKLISDDLFSKLKLQISKKFLLQNELETFQIQSKRLSAAEDFLFLGKGDFKLVYSNFKNVIDASKYPEQAKAQKELQSMFDLFLILAFELNSQINVIKNSTNVSLRTDELNSMIYYSIIINFPYLKELIQKNYNKHTPLNFDPKNP
jgi:hypothetical protein